MKNKQNALFKIIVLILIMIISATHVFAHEETSVDAIVGCSKYITDCANNVISLALEHTAMDEEETIGNVVGHSDEQNTQPKIMKIIKKNKNQN